MKIVGYEPCFRVLDVERAVSHYQRLGFETEYHDDTYAFAHRDHLTIHLAHDDDSTHHVAMLYIHVDDAEALAAEWRAADGRDRSSRLRVRKHEGTHTDPDGNLIRFGSPIPS